jgi:hypothetical protein
VGGDGMKRSAWKESQNSPPLRRKSAKKDEAERAKNRRKLTWERMREAQRISSDERLCRCHWAAIGFDVKIKKCVSDVARPAIFRNVETCSRIWTCPMCGGKISAKRQKELLKAFVNAAVLGLHVYMVTYTVRHKKYDPVKKVLRLVVDAVSRLKAARFWTRVSDELGIVGSITALEPTFSRENGAHVHKHTLEFCKRELSADEIAKLRDRISAEYRKKLSALGGSADPRFDVHIMSGADYLAEYISKFGHNPKDDKRARSGLSYEMTRNNSKGKSSIEGHYTMLQLLDLSADGDEWARVMWRSSEKAFRKHAQLTWSRKTKNKPGLREVLNMDAEQTDAEIVAEDEPEYTDFARLVRCEWAKARRIPHEVLEAAKEMTFPEFVAFMADHGIEVEPPVIELVSEWGNASKFFG